MATKTTENTKLDETIVDEEDAVELNDLRGEKIEK